MHVRTFRTMTHFFRFLDVCILRNKHVRSVSCHRTGMDLFAFDSRASIHGVSQTCRALGWVFRTNGPPRSHGPSGTPRRSDRTVSHTEQMQKRDGRAFPVLVRRRNLLVSLVWTHHGCDRNAHGFAVRVRSFGRVTGRNVRMWRILRIGLIRVRRCANPIRARVGRIKTWERELAKSQRPRPRSRGYRWYSAFE